MAFIAIASVSYASAEWTTYYVVEQVGQEYSAFSTFKIDWENKYFFLDSDSEDETKGPIKALKTNGNKKTFNVHYTKVLNEEFFFSAEFVTDGEGKFTLTQNIDGNKRTFILTDKKPAGTAIKEARQNPGTLIKDGFGKVSDFIKKKKEDNKEKKSKKE